MHVNTKTGKALKAHATKRMRQRFDIDFNRHVYRDACLCISHQKQVGTCKPLKPVEKCSDNRSMWLIEVKDVAVIAIWDKKRQAIATFMPVEWKLNSRMGR